MSRSRGRAAFTRDDVEDAERGYPATDLSPWAQHHGLELLPPGRLPSGFDAVLPVWAEYVFGCMRGELHSELVTLMHELYEVGASPDGLDMGGAFHAVRSVSRWSWFGLWDSGPKNEPFATNAVWVPATRGAVRVTEAALVDRLVIRRSDRFPLFGTKNLGDHGLPSFRLAGDCDDAFVARLVAGEVGEVLRYFEHPYVELVIDSGHVTLVRNGYARPDQLDRFGAQLAAVARGVRAAVGPTTAPAPFDTALPAPPWADPAWRSEDRMAFVDEPWRDGFRRAAAEQQLVLEDPAAFHRAFPGQPVPGRAQGVARGRVEGLPGTVRLGWFTGGAGPVHAKIRAALLFTPAEGVTTPTAGLRDDTLGVHATVAGGIGAVWFTRYSQGELRTRDILAAGTEAVRRLGLV